MRLRACGFLTIGLLVTAGCGGTDFSNTVAASTTPTSISSSGTTGTTLAIPVGWVNYTDPSGVKLQHPRSWTTQPGQLGPLILFVDPTLDDGGFRRNVNVLVQQMAGTDDDEYLKLSLGQISDLDGTVEASDAATLDGVDGHQITWHLSKNGLTLRFLSVWALRGGHVYLVTYTADADNFDAALPDARQLIASLQLPPS